MEGCWLNGPVISTFNIACLHSADSSEWPFEPRRGSAAGLQSRHHMHSHAGSSGGGACSSRVQRNIEGRLCPRQALPDTICLHCRAVDGVTDLPSNQVDQVAVCR